MRIILFLFLFFLFSACVKVPDYYSVNSCGQVIAPDGFDWKMNQDRFFSFCVLSSGSEVIRVSTSVYGDLIAFGPDSPSLPVINTLSLPKEQTSLFVLNIASGAMGSNTGMLSVAGNHGITTWSVSTVVRSRFLALIDILRLPLITRLFADDAINTLFYDC